jgi:hypothetical protein
MEDRTPIALNINIRFHLLTTKLALHSSFTILSHKLNKSRINILRMRETQEVLAPFHNLQLRIRTIDKLFDLPLCVLHRIHRVRSAMQPQHRTPDIEQPPVQTIPISQIDSRHASAPPPIIAGVVVRDFLAPVVAVFVRYALAETDVDEEVGVFLRQLEGGYRVVGGEEVDHVCEVTGSVPAAQVPGFLGLVVHGCAEGDDAGDLMCLACELRFIASRSSHTLSGANNAILAVIHPP